MEVRHFEASYTLRIPLCLVGLTSFPLERKLCKWASDFAVKKQFSLMGFAQLIKEKC